MQLCECVNQLNLDLQRAEKLNETSKYKTQLADVWLLNLQILVLSTFFSFFLWGAVNLWPQVNAFYWENKLTK